MPRVSMYTDSLSFVYDRSRTIVGVAESIRKICGHRLTEILNSNEGADDRDMANVSRVEALHMCGHGCAVTESSGEELKAPCKPFGFMGSADRNLGLWGRCVATVRFVGGIAISSLVGTVARCPPRCKRNGVHRSLEPLEVQMFALVHAV